MEFLKILPLRGPNIWTYRPVMEVWLDIGILEDSPSNTIPGFYERLSAWLPTLIEHRCGVGERGGFLLRLQEGTWPGHILEHVTIELQNLAGMQSGFGKARSTSVRGVYKVVVRSRNEEVTHAALHAARDLVLAAMQDHPYDVQAAVDRLHEMVDDLCLGPSTACIVDAATERRIPSIRLTEGNLVQLGHGIRQRRIWTAETDQTSAIAESIASDKDLTKSLLQSCGVPVPEGRVVTSPADAWEAAEDIGVPVVVKPSDANHGRGVSTELMTQKEVEAAYVLADAEGSEVLVERFVRGNEHRLLVVGGKLAAAARGESLSVMADGQSTLRQLIDTQINIDPRRGTTEEFPLNLILLEDDPTVRFELERQGYSGDDIPPTGKAVLIQRNGNVAIDVTDDVHPSTAEAVSLAARVVGLDIAGVDLVVQDISRPLDEQGGAIVEINAGPSLIMHLKPAQGEPRPVGKAIVDNLFAEDNNGRIPIVGISGANGQCLTAYLVAKLLHLRGQYVGLACSDGLFFAHRQIDKRNCANWVSAQKILLNRSVEAAVIESSSNTILTEGLGYDRCQVGIVLHLDEPQDLEQFYIETPEQVSNVLRTQIDVVLSDGVGVLNADDAMVAQMAEYCDGEVIYFAQQTAIDAAHLDQGGRAVLGRDGGIIIVSGSNEFELMKLDQVAALKDNQCATQIESVLAAVAAAWALDIPHELIRAGLTSVEKMMTNTKGNA